MINFQCIVQMDIIKQNKILLATIGLAFIISLTHSFYFKLESIVDARAYDKIAVNLSQGRGYLEDVGVPLSKDFAIARVGPGYEFFLAGAYKIFGHQYWPIWLAQAMFQALTVLIVYLTAREIFAKNWHPAIGLAAAALVAGSPDLIVASSMLLTENLAVFLLVAALYFFFRFFNQGGRVNLILFPAFYFSAVLVRSQLSLMALIFLVFFIWRKQWKQLAVFVLVALVFFAPWIIRNYSIFDEFIPFNASLGYNLWVGNHPGASGEMAIDYQPIIDYNETHSPFEVNREGIKQFELFVLQHPAEFVKITLKRISIFFSFSRPTGFWPNFSEIQKIATAAFSSIYSVIIFTFGFAGIWLAFKNSPPPQKNLLKYFLWLALMIPLGVIFILVETRYRYPLYPFLAVFGGYAIFVAYQNFKKIIQPLATAFLILLANTTLDVFNNLERIFKYLGK